MNHTFKWQGRHDGDGIAHQRIFHTVNQAEQAEYALLGFSSDFKKTNWSISKIQWEHISNRLNKFYKICCQYHSPQGYMFVLNDAVIKTYFVNEKNNIFSTY